MDKEQNNLAKVLWIGYVRAGEVSSLTNYFCVPKGEDIRMVYNGTSSGLNGALWDPNFVLPTVASMLRVVEGGGTCRIGTYKRCS